MRRSEPHPSWAGRPAVSRDGQIVGRVLRTHGDVRGWPEHLVLDLDGRLLALPAADSLLANDAVHLPYNSPRLTGARPLDDGAQDDPAAVGRAVAVFEEPSRAPIAEDPDAMTVSEEQLHVSVRAVPTERVRLRKVLVEREVSVPVRVRHEELEVVREPVGPDTPAEPGSEVFEGVAAEIVLHAERPVVGREVVPVERVRLVKHLSGAEVTVGAELRKEEVVVDRLPVDGPS